MKVIIDRATWNTAKRHGVPSLLSRNNSRCCLGFLGTACGANDGVLRNVAYPARVRDLADWPAALFERVSTNGYDHDLHKVMWQEVFARLNDTPLIDDATREQWISEGFRIVLGCEVEYVGEYPGGGK